MSEVINPKKEETLRVLYLREGSKEVAVGLGLGFMIYGDDNSARVSFCKYADKYEYVDVDADPEGMMPDVPGMSLVQKLTMRFQEAARRGTDVDLRFCSGDKKLRRPEHDNLRADYPGCVMGMKVGV